MKVSIIIFLIGFLSVIPAVIIGTKMFDGRVEAGTYEKGLVYDETRRIIKEKGIELNVTETAYKDGGASVYFSLGESFRPENIRAEISRPAGREILYAEAARLDDGYMLSLPEIEQGNHILKVTFDADGKEIGIRRNFYINR